MSPARGFLGWLKDRIWPTSESTSPEPGVFARNKLARLEQAGDASGLASLLEQQPNLEVHYTRTAKEAFHTDNLWKATAYAVALAMRNSRYAEEVLGLLIHSQEWRKISAAMEDQEAFVLAEYLLERQSYHTSTFLHKCSAKQVESFQNVFGDRYPDAFLMLPQLASNLGARPELQARIRERALQAAQKDELAHCTKLLGVLLRCGSTESLPLVRELFSLSQRASLLRSLEPEQAPVLVRLCQANDPGLVLPLLKGLRDEVFASVGRTLAGTVREQWLYLALERESCYREAADELAGWKSNPASEDIPIGGTALSAVFEATVEQLQKELAQPVVSGTLESVTRRAWVLSELCEEDIPAGIHDSLARKLPELSLLGVPSAAHILGQQPNTAWMAPLRTAWLRIDDLARRQEYGGHRDEQAPKVSQRRSRTGSPVQPGLELAASAVASAWAACAGKDSTYHSFASDRQLMDRYDRVSDQLRDAAERQEGLLHQLREEGDSPRADHTRDEIRMLQRRIERLANERDELHNSVRNNVSVGYLLSLVVSNAQQYPIGVRQAAAWAIYLLLGNSHLDNEAKSHLRQTLTSALDPKTPEGEAVEDHRFRERRVYLPSHPTKAEMFLNLRAGLLWMHAMESLRHSDPETAIAPTTMSNTEEETLRAICDLALQELPGAISFFQEFPLRLMNLQDHRQVLGNYTEDGCQMERWIRFTPPWKTGPVEERYYQLDNRSLPNSMGVYYRLFVNPLLVLPVLYHEYLHYAGTTGRRANAIDNEMEVKIRELLFLRRLTAQLAPKDDADLPDYENALVADAERIDSPSLLLGLLEHIEDDQSLDQLNQEVVAAYGAPLPISEAMAKADLKINEFNYQTWRINTVETWHPEKEYPVLDDTHPLTVPFRDLLQRRWQQQHEITLDDRNRIFREEFSRQALETWADYATRPGALQTLVAAHNRIQETGTQEAIRRLIIRRFDYALPNEEGLPQSDLEGLIHNLLEQYNHPDDEPGLDLESQSG